MAANTHIKYPLCVEWTTKLPFESSPSKSTRISLLGSGWFFELKNCSDNFVLSLCIINSEKPRLDHVFVKISVLVGAARKFSEILISQENIQKGYIFLWSKAREEILSEIPSIFRTGKMKIICIFHWTEADVDKTLVLGDIDSASSIRYSIASSLQILSKDFSTFLKNDTLSDVTLICADHVFSAHWLVLAARSEVFADISRKKENKATGVVEIRNIDPDVLELLLQYMYSGERPELREDTARRLYEAADKYAVHGLKEACSYWMLESHTPEKLLDLLVLADEHSDKHFKEAVVCFLTKQQTPHSVKSWSTFKEKYPKLAFLVLEKRLEDPVAKVAERAGK